MIRPLLLCAWLLACGGGGSPQPADAPDPEPVATPAPAPAADTPAADHRCAAVVTANDATTMYQLGRGLGPTDGCTFEDVQVDKSTVTLAFETADKTKAPSTLRPSVCVGKPSDGAVVKDPWVLEIPESSRTLCPDGYEKLVAAVVTGRFPPPSAAR